MAELKDFVKKLKSDKIELYARHQEDEWGIRYQGDGNFLYWTRNAFENNYHEDILTENQVMDLLVNYSIKTLELFLK